VVTCDLASANGQNAKIKQVIRQSLMVDKFFSQFLNSHNQNRNTDDPHHPMLHNVKRVVLIGGIVTPKRYRSLAERM
jgi:hypothetical protein